MESRIMQVFYGNDCLPYKDKERSVHYPVVGNSFAGASDTTKIRFYVKDIGGVENVTWVAVVKLPNGKIGFKVLSTIGNDLEVGERYVEFSLNSFYTQYNGDLAIALKGYQGGVQVEEDTETGIYEIVGTPTIQATGVIKLSVNYSTQLPLTQGLSPDELTQLMALIAEKLNIASGIVVLLNDDEDISGYTNGQFFYVVSRNQFMQLIENELEEKELKVYNIVPGQQATLSIIANNLTNINGRYLSSYESNSVVISDYPCYKITRGGENLNEDYAAAYMEFMTGSKYLPKYDYEHPKNTYFINPDGLILKPQYDDTNGLLLYPMTYLATRNYVDNDIISIADTSTPLTYEQRQKILTKNVRVQYNNHYYEKVKENSYSVIFECCELNFTTSNGSTTISKNIITIIKATGTIVASTKNLVTYSQEQANQYFANNVQMSVDSNYVLKVKLIDKNGDQLAEDSVDLPLESIVQSAQYYETYTYQGTTYENVIVITLATTSVPTIIPVGDLVSGLVSESTYNSGMATKVDKTDSANKVYGTNGSGSQTTYNVDSNVSGNVVRRDNNSQIIVPTTPTNNAHATSKGYVDTFAKDVALSLDQSTYVLTITLKNANDGTIVTRSVDLPLETMVVSGSYDEINKAIVLTLKNGQTISIPVGDLISGLVSTDYLQANYYNKTQIDDMVSGFVFADVDDHLSSVSTNPVENRVITLALETKANVDGNYPTLTAGLSDNLNTKIVDNDVNAYLFRPTGGLNTESGNNCKEKAIVGGSLGFNQLLDALATGNYGFADASGSFSSGVATFTPSAQNGRMYNSASIRPNTIAGHKYLMSCDIKLTTGSTNIGFYVDANPTQYITTQSKTEKQTLEKVFSATNSASSVVIRVQDNRASDWDAIQVSNMMLIDLTAMFGSIIADYILSLETATSGAGVAWFKRYFNKPYYPYTLIGAFQNVKTRGKKIVGFNQFDGEYELGGIIATDGSLNPVTNRHRSKNFNRCLPNTTYYCKTSDSVRFVFYDINYNWVGYSGVVSNSSFTTPENTAFYKVTTIDDTNPFPNNFNVNFHYDGERDGEYEPYESETYACDDIELIGIPKIDAQGNLYYEGDIYRPDGTVEKRFKAVDMGTLTWDLTTNSLFRAYLSDIKIASSNDQDSGLICPRFKVLKTQWNTSNAEDNTIWKYVAEDQIRVNCSAYSDAATFKTAMSGIYLVYELATPTEDSATPYPENQPCNNWGTEERIDNREVQIPVGHDTDYPLDLKSKLEILPNLPSDDGVYVCKVESGTGEYVALGSWLVANGYTKLTDISGYDAEKTQTLKNVEGTLTWVDD